MKAFVDGLIDNDENVASSKTEHTQFTTEVQTAIPYLSMANKSGQN